MNGKHTFSSNDLTNLVVYFRAIMFHIGVATQHPPLPDPDQLSELGINFIKQCLTIDAMRRPTAVELLNHPWMVTFRQALEEYEDEAVRMDGTSDSESMLSAITRQAIIAHDREVAEILASPLPSIRSET